MDLFTSKNGIQFKRHFYNGVDYELVGKDKVVRLLPEFEHKLHSKKLWGTRGYKKVGGSSFGSIVGLNSFSSSFEESLKMMWLGMPILDMKYINAGNVIEPKVIAVIEAEHPDVKEWKTYPAAENNYDFFSNREHFGGLPDLVDHTNKIVYEIKTTGAKNKERWDKFGVPKYYIAQALLYAGLMGMNKAVIAAVYLEPEDYPNPEDKVVKEGDVSYWEFNLADGIDGVPVMDYVLQAKKFRMDIIKSGESLPWDTDGRPKEMTMEWLLCKNKEDVIEWEKKWG